MTVRKQNSKPNSKPNPANQQDRFAASAQDRYGSNPLRADRRSSEEEERSFAREADAVRRVLDCRDIRGHTDEISVSRIRPNKKNARIHSERQISLLMASIETFGFIGVVVVDENNVIISGHGRFEAARRLGLTSLPCIRVTHLSAEAKAALALADNKLADLSSWNDVVLAETLGELSSANLDFDIEVTGFDTVDIDRLFVDSAQGQTTSAKQTEVSTDPADAFPDVRRNQQSVSQPGMLWQLDSHRILQGDALDPTAFACLLGRELAVQVTTDPPYNVPNAGHVSSKVFREFPMAHGEMSTQQFTEFLTKFLKNSATHLRDGAVLHVFMDWRHLREMLDAADAAKLAVKNLCVWAKSSPGQGSFYRSQHELVFVLKHGASPPVNNFGLGARGRTRSNVWKYPAVRGARTGVNDPDGGHPTVKPVSLIMDAIRDCSMRGDCILDPFGGSGTTIMAAERVGRRARVIELDGHYVDLAIRRWQTATGKNAIHTESGLTFNEMERHLLDRIEEDK